MKTYKELMSEGKAESELLELIEFMECDFESLNEGLDFRSALKKANVFSKDNNGLIATITRAGIKSNVGRKATDETKRKMSETRTGKDNGFYGKKHTPESIEKMKKNSTGKRHTEETKSKMGSSRMGNQNAKGHTPSKEAIRKRVETFKKTMARKRKQNEKDTRH